MASRTYITSCNVLYTHIHYFELCADIYFTFARGIFTFSYISWHLNTVHYLRHMRQTLLYTERSPMDLSLPPFSFIMPFSSMVSYVYQLIPMRAITLPSSWYIVIVLLKNSHPPRMVRLTFSNPNIWCVKRTKNVNDVKLEIEMPHAKIPVEQICAIFPKSKFIGCEKSGRV